MFSRRDSQIGMITLFLTLSMGKHYAFILSLFYIRYYYIYSRTKNY